LSWSRIGHSDTAMTEYTQTQREQVRQTLLTYMKEHKIGVPRLAARIHETVYRKPTIPVKTLQRFMKGEVRTIDQYVAFMFQFADVVAKVDPTPSLGSALNTFYSSANQTDWAGSFSVGETESSAKNSTDNHQSTIEIVLDRGTWRVKETSREGKSLQVHDGAMTSSGSTVVMVLRDRLSGLPRLINASRNFDGYEGISSSAYYLVRTGMNMQFAVRTKSARIALRRQP
jgi:hypothetical protein